MGGKESAVFNGKIKLGVLGGGQLGKMMALPAANWHLPYWVLDVDETVPAATYATNFVAGDFRNKKDVLAFGKKVDVLTIEIEHVHTGALRKLQAAGKIVHPAPEVLDIIKDKGTQKQFYVDQGLPTSPFQLFSGKGSIRKAVQEGKLSLPFVQKSRTEGYDGKGVAVIQTAEDLRRRLLPGPAVVEDLVAIDKELAVIVARNARGEVRSFPVVEMVFDPVANLVDYLFSPAQISLELAQKATQIAEDTAAAYQLSGLLAVELFLTKAGEILINEVAPRPHNSGHHTIESCPTSQFEQHLRAVLNLPLGDTQLRQVAVMVNILGEPGYTGDVRYEGMEVVMGIPGVFVHLYGKQQTRPFRKMGHVTILADTPPEALAKAEQVKQALKCKGESGKGVNV